MRIAVFVGVLVLSSGWLRGEESHTIGLADIAAWNNQLRALGEYFDNEFIYYDKVEQAASELEQHVGASIKIPLTVVSVRSQQVNVTVSTDKFQEETGVPVFPFYVLKEPLGKGVVAERNGRVPFVPPSNLRGSNVGAGLAVGDLVPLELAKTLRRGDTLLLTGVIDSIIIAPRAGEPAPHRTGIAIKDAQVTSATERAGN